MKWGGPLFLISACFLAFGTKMISTGGKPKAPFREESVDMIRSSSAGGTGDRNNGNTPPSPDPSGSPPPGGYPPGEPGDGTGVDREWRGYVETDVEALRAQLPPQAQHLAEYFVEAGQAYDIDPLFLAAISQHETGNWTSNAFYNRNNAMGISNASGVINQSSHQASINNMAASLAGAPGTAGYYNGTNTVGQTGAIYAPIGAGNDPNGQNNYWASGVGQYYDNFANNLR